MMFYGFTAFRHNEYITFEHSQVFSQMLISCSNTIYQIIYTFLTFTIILIQLLGFVFCFCSVSRLMPHYFNYSSELEFITFKIFFQVSLAIFVFLYIGLFFF